MIFCDEFRENYSFIINGVLRVGIIFEIKNEFKEIIIEFGKGWLL